MSCAALWIAAGAAGAGTTTKGAPSTKAASPAVFRIEKTHPAKPASQDTARKTSAAKTTSLDTARKAAATRTATSDTARKPSASKAASPDTTRKSATAKAAARDSTRKLPAPDSVASKQTAAAKPDSGTSVADSAARRSSEPTSAAKKETADKPATSTRVAATPAIHDTAAVKVAAPRQGESVAEKKPPLRRGARSSAWTLRIAVIAASLLAIALAVVVLLRRRSEEQRFMTSTRLSTMDKEVQRACRFIERACKNPALSPEDVSGELVTGTAFLQALFIRELGISVEAFIEQVRVNRVKIALQEQPSADPALLARESGFGDLAVMERSFRKITGAGIAEYAKAVHRQGTAA